MRRLSMIPAMQRAGRGDTLVELLVVIAIVSLVLAGAFVATNNSLQQSRDSQERVNALKLAESQLEQIKSLTQSKKLDLWNHPGVTAYCLLPGPALRPTGVLYKDANGACKLNTRGVTANTGEPAFAVSITGPDTDDRFVINVMWESSVRNQDNNTANDSELGTVQLVYRAHK